MSILRKLRELCEGIMIPDDIMDMYGSDTPNYVLKKIKADAERKGYVIDVKKQDRDNFYMIVKTPYGDVRNLKVSKQQVVSDPDASIEDLI